jgi:hypothetical protein
MIENFLHDGPIVLGALAVLILAGILLLTWVFLALRRRRLYPLLAATSIGLGLVGFVAIDWRHLSLNFSMHDADSVRQECIRLIDHRQATLESENQELHLHGSEIPASLTRLGATFVRVTRSNVQISLIPLSPLTGGAWGFLYDPTRAYLTDGRPDDVRATWYRDFYEFRVRGE